VHNNKLYVGGGYELKDESFYVRNLRYNHELCCVVESKMSNPTRKGIVLKRLEVRGELGLGTKEKPFVMNFDPDFNILVGPNGCGKTRLLMIINSMLFQIGAILENDQQKESFSNDRIKLEMEVSEDAFIKLLTNIVIIRGCSNNFDGNDVENPKELRCHLKERAREFFKDAYKESASGDKFVIELSHACGIKNVTPKGDIELIRNIKPSCRFLADRLICMYNFAVMDSIEPESYVRTYKKGIVMQRAGPNANYCNIGTSLGKEVVRKKEKINRRIKSLLDVVKNIEIYISNGGVSIKTRKNGLLYSSTYGESDLVSTWLTANLCDGVLLLDEPFSHCHPELAWEMLRDIRKSGKQIIMTTHLEHMIRPENVKQVQIVHEHGVVRFEDFITGKNKLEGASFSNVAQVNGINRIALSRRALIVEGTDDEIIYNTFMESINKDYLVVNAGGKEGIPTLFQISNTELRKTVKAIFDSDWWFNIISWIFKKEGNKKIETCNERMFDKYLGYCEGLFDRTCKYRKELTENKNENKDEFNKLERLLKGNGKQRWEEVRDCIEKCLGENEDKYRKILMENGVYIIKTKYKDLEGIMKTLKSMEGIESKKAFKKRYFKNPPKVLIDMKEACKDDDGPWVELKEFIERKIEINT
jgi:energy-coupling factor transporter ATP-binding protein EcfA2